MNRTKRASLKDVATRAGTSTATASRALSGHGYISPKARDNVLRAAHELNYQPNLQARSLRQQASHTIGLLIPNLLNAYYTTLADSLSQLLNEQGYHLLLSSTRDDPAIEQEMLYDMIGFSVDGLIWVPTSAGDTDLIRYLLDQHIPAISLVRRVQDDVLDTIVFEDIAGSQAATQHLISMGHECIGYIGGDTRHSSNYDRWQGYLAAMKVNGLPVDSSLVRLGSTWSVWGEVAARELLQLPSPPTAIFVASNAIMPGVIKTLRQSNLRLPEEMSLICFDDLDWFSYSTPPITAITHDHAQLAKAAVDLLFNRIRQGQGAVTAPRFIKLDFDLVLRKSTAPPCPR